MRSHRPSARCVPIINLGRERRVTSADRHQAVVKALEDDRMRPLHISVVTETYPPEVNGVATTLARVVEGLRAQGHTVGLVRPRQPADGCQGDAARADPTRPHRGEREATGMDRLVTGLPIPRYPHLRMGLPAGRVLRDLWSVHRPDVVHVATEGPLGFSAVQAARALGLPVTSDFRTNFHAYTGHYGIGWLKQPILAYLRSFHNRTAATMVPTGALASRLHAEGFERLRVVSRGVDVGRFDPARRSEALRAEWGARDDEPVALYVGRLAAEKNLDLLVRAFRTAQASVPATRLVIVGDGPMRAALQTAVPEAHFAGQRLGTDLAAHYASADLFLFPSLTETFGNVVAEAMASGLAVVTYDYAAGAELIESGLDGILVACGNEAQFQRSAAALAASGPMRRTMGQRARVRACANGWPAVLARFEGVLQQAIRGDADGVGLGADMSGEGAVPSSTPTPVWMR